MLVLAYLPLRKNKQRQTVNTRNNTHTYTYKHIKNKTETNILLVIMVCECDYLYRMDDTADTHWYMRETGQLVRIDATNADFLHLFSPAADLS